MQKNIIPILFIISIELFSCSKDNNSNPTPAEPVILNNYTGQYSGTRIEVETYPNDPSIPTKTSENAFSRRIDGNKYQFHLYDPIFKEDLYFSTPSNTISKSSLHVNGNITQSISVKWEIKGDSLIGYSRVNNFENSILVHDVRFYSKLKKR